MKEKGLLPYGVYSIIVVLSVFKIVSVRSGNAEEIMMQRSIYGFSAKTIDGQEITLDKYKGHVLLIVNTASHCGFTKQYAGLQELHERFYDRGFRVLGFPSNDFLLQEPGTDQEIKEFCSLKYHVTFDMFSKIKVKGKRQHPLFAYLTTQPQLQGKVSWNFNKFLIDREGNIVARFGTQTDPLSKEVVEAISAIIGNEGE